MSAIDYKQIRKAINLRCLGYTWPQIGRLFGVTPGVAEGAVRRFRERRRNNN